jgi:hypothetical protein
MAEALRRFAGLGQQDEAVRPDRNAARPEVNAAAE